MQVVELRHASRLISFGPTVLISSAHQGRLNLMAAAWSMPVEFTPPRLAVVIDKSTWSRELIAASGTLAINVPCRAQADLTFTVGSVSGRDRVQHGQPDKFESLQIGYTPGARLGLPLVHGCLAWMECRVLSEPHSEECYDTFFVEVVGAWADPRVFREGRWQLADVPAELAPIHHLGGGLFTVAGPTLQARRLDESSEGH